jgi:hypothetical protein
VHNPWLALGDGSDLAERSRALRQAHEAFAITGQVSVRLRPVVAESWRRCACAGVDPEGAAPPVTLTGAELTAYRDNHPLARVVPLLRELLGGIAEDGRHVMAVCDAAGRLLWVEGEPSVVRQARRINFVEGAWWDELHAGTNAPAVALAVDHAVQIFSGEHFRSMAQPWTCCAAPIHDPVTGEILGAVDLTGGDHLATPHSFALVQAAARIAEAELARVPAQRSEPIGPRPLQLRVLGCDEGLLVSAGRRLRLSRRHSEMLTVLLGHPAGIAGDRLGFEIYGEAANPVTLRAEISRLRTVLGSHLLGSRPYRLQIPVEADFLTVSQLLEEGDLRSALATYRGPLLPRSDAPGVERARRRLDGQLRATLVASADTTLIESWTQSSWGQDDVEMWQVLARALPDPSPRRTLADARARDLTAELAAPTRRARIGATGMQRPAT